MTRAGPQVWEIGTFSVVTSLVPRGPYFFSYSASQLADLGRIASRRRSPAGGRA